MVSLLGCTPKSIEGDGGNALDSHKACDGPLQFSEASCLFLFAVPGRQVRERPGGMFQRVGCVDEDSCGRTVLPSLPPAVMGPPGKGFLLGFSES